MIELTLEAWKKATQYVRQKRDLGDQMVRRDTDFEEGRSLMDDLPIRIIINQISVGEAEKLSERANKALDLWTKAAQNFYHLRPV